MILPDEYNSLSARATVMNIISDCENSDNIQKSVCTIITRKTTLTSLLLV